MDNVSRHRDINQFGIGKPGGPNALSDRPIQEEIVIFCRVFGHEWLCGFLPVVYAARADGTFQLIIHEFLANFFHLFPVPALFQGHLVQVSDDQHVFKIGIFYREIPFTCYTERIERKVAAAHDLGVMCAPKQIVDFGHIAALVINILENDLVCKAIKNLEIVVTHVLGISG